MALELNHEQIDSPPRDAASVVLLRDGEDGALEVLLLRRSERSDVLAGAYVFPGGKVDAADADSFDGRADAHAFGRSCWESLADPAIDVRAAAAMYVAAARETLEEAGVELMPELLVPFSRWITPRVPSVMRKRFDTRFFVADLPAGASARHDAHEAVDSVWLRPRVALEQYWAGEISMAPPQLMSLAELSRYARAGDALTVARGRRPRTIEPEPFAVDGVRVVAYPGDPRHPIAERAMPGPFRLMWKNNRFEPESGFDEFFA